MKLSLRALYLYYWSWLFKSVSGLVFIFQSDFNVNFKNCLREKWKITWKANINCLINLVPSFLKSLNSCLETFTFYVYIYHESLQLNLQNMKGILDSSATILHSYDDRSNQTTFLALYWIIPVYLQHWILLFKSRVWALMKKSLNHFYTGL